MAVTQVVTEKDRVEARSHGANKASMVACLLRSKVGSRGGRVLPRSGNDIIICFGNDADDEEMFELLSGQEEAVSGSRTPPACPVDSQTLL